LAGKVAGRGGKKSRPSRVGCPAGRRAAPLRRGKGRAAAGRVPTFAGAVAWERQYAESGRVAPAPVGSASSAASSAGGMLRKKCVRHWNFGPIWGTKKGARLPPPLSGGGIGVSKKAMGGPLRGRRSALFLFRGLGPACPGTQPTLGTWRKGAAAQIHRRRANARPFARGRGRRRIGRQRWRLLNQGRLSAAFHVGAGPRRRRGSSRRAKRATSCRGRSRR